MTKKNEKFLSFLTVVFLVIFMSPVLLAGNAKADDAYKPGAGWRLVWSDEFNGTAIDPSNWSFEIGRGPNNDGGGTWSLQYYTGRPDNVYIKDGALVIKMIKEEYKGAPFTSALVTTQYKKFWKYGKIAARMKLPYGYALWPGFCMYGTNKDSVGWPACGEIDIMELRGGDPGDNKLSNNGTVQGAIHWRNGSASTNFYDYWSWVTGSVTLPAGRRFADDYHVFEIEWDSKQIVWKLDGVSYFTQDITAPDRSEFHNACYFYFNLAVGGTFFGEIPNVSQITAPFPQYMYIDWVRVYTNKY